MFLSEERFIVARKRTVVAQEPIFFFLLLLLVLFRDAISILIQSLLKTDQEQHQSLSRTNPKYLRD